MGTTALIGPALLISPLLISPLAARAANITISAPTNATQALGAGDSLTVTNTGSISAVNPAVSVINVTALSVNNSGGVSGISSGVLVKTKGDISSGITNRGTIQGRSEGVLVNISSNISGGILNNGTISSNHTGLNVANFSSISGGITNSGKISGGSVGVVSGNNSNISGGVVNQAGGVISGGIIGIYVEGLSKLVGGIANQAGGVVSGGTYGILVAGDGNISGAITNSGKISGDIGGVMAQLTSTISGGVDNGVGGIIFGGSGAGIWARNSSDISGGITNSGTISSGNVGIYVQSNSDISGGVHNQAGGMITGQTGISVSASKISGGITNAGTIDGTGGTAISLVGLTGPTPITISGGQIIGDVLDNAPVNGFSPVTVTGNFTSQGNFSVSSFSVSPGAAFTFGAGNNVTSNSAVSDSGTIVVSAAGSSITGGLSVNAGGVLTTGGSFAVNGALTNAGTITVDNGKVLTATTFTGSAGSALNIQVGRAAGTLTGGELVATGSAVDLRNTALAISIVAGSQQLANGSTLVIANGNAVEVAADDPLKVTDNASSLYKFTVTPGSGVTADDLLLTATISRSAATGPTVDDSGRTAALDVSDNVLALTEGRLTALRDGDYETNREKTARVEAGSKSRDGAAGEPNMSGMAAGNLPRGADAWGEAFGQHADQGERDNIAGFSASTWGGAAGIDTRNIADDVVAGVAVSYGHTDASSDNANTTATGVDSYQVTLYGDYDPIGESYIDGMVAYSWNRDETTRHDVGGVTGLDAHGSYDADQVAAQVEAGREYAAGETILTPDIMAHAVWYGPRSYTESGAGGADLNVSGNNQTLIELGAGIKAGWIYGESDGSIIKPQIRAGYRYALVDDRIEDTAQFTGGGGTFTTQGPDPARSSVNLGGTLRYYTPSNWNFTASYDFDWKQDYTANAGSIKAGYRF